MYMNRQILSRTRQSGAALIIALIFLLLMTMLSTTSMRTSTMQERMAGHMRDWNLGFQAAEASLRAAEDFLLTTVVLPPFNDTNGFYQVNSVDRPVWEGDTITNGNGFVTYADTVPDVSQQPRFYFEKLSSIRPAGSETETGTPVEEVFFFRVTAIGFGGAVGTDGNPLSNVVVSSVFRSR